MNTETKFATNQVNLTKTALIAACESKNRNIFSFFLYHPFKKKTLFHYITRPLASVADIKTYISFLFFLRRATTGTKK